MVLTFEQLLAQRDRERQEAGERSLADDRPIIERIREYRASNTNTTDGTIESNFITFEDLMERTYGEKERLEQLKQEWLEGTGLDMDVYTSDTLTEEQLELLNKLFNEDFTKVKDIYSPFTLNKFVLPQLDEYTERLSKERKIKELGLFKEPDLDLGDGVEVTKTITLNL